MSDAASDTAEKQSSITKWKRERAESLPKPRLACPFCSSDLGSVERRQCSECGHRLISGRSTEARLGGLAGAILGSAMILFMIGGGIWGLSVMRASGMSTTIFVLAVLAGSAMVGYVLREMGLFTYLGQAFGKTTVAEHYVALGEMYLSQRAEWLPAAAYCFMWSLVNTVYTGYGVGAPKIIVLRRDYPDLLGDDLQVREVFGDLVFADLCMRYVHDKRPWNLAGIRLIQAVAVDSGSQLALAGLLRKFLSQTAWQKDLAHIVYPVAPQVGRAIWEGAGCDIHGTPVYTAGDLLPDSVVDVYGAPYQQELTLDLGDNENLLYALFEPNDVFAITTERVLNPGNEASDSIADVRLAYVNEKGWSFVIGADNLYQIGVGDFAQGFDAAGLKSALLKHGHIEVRQGKPTQKERSGLRTVSI